MEGKEWHVFVSKPYADDFKRLRDRGDPDLARVTTAFRAIQADPYDDDGEQPGLFPGAVRKVCGNSMHRIIYEIDEAEDTIYLNRIYTVPKL